MFGFGSIDCQLHILLNFGGFMSVGAMGNYVPENVWTARTGLDGQYGDATSHRVDRAARERFSLSPSMYVVCAYIVVTAATGGQASILTGFIIGFVSAIFFELLKEIGGFSYDN